MAAPDRTKEASQPEEHAADDGEPSISAYSTSDERVVFTESDNDDGWISTDVTVDVEQ